MDNVPASVRLINTVLPNDTCSLTLLAKMFSPAMGAPFRYNDNDKLSSGTEPFAK